MSGRYLTPLFSSAQSWAAKNIIINLNVTAPGVNNNLVLSHIIADLAQAGTTSFASTGHQRNRFKKFLGNFGFVCRPSSVRSKTGVLGHVSRSPCMHRIFGGYVLRRVVILWTRFSPTLSHFLPLVFGSHKVLESWNCAREALIFCILNTEASNVWGAWTCTTDEARQGVAVPPKEYRADMAGIPVSPCHFVQLNAKWADFDHLLSPFVKGLLTCTFSAAEDLLAHLI